MRGPIPHIFLIFLIALNMLKEILPPKPVNIECMSENIKSLIIQLIHTE